MSKEIDLFVGRKIREKRKLIGFTLNDIAESLNKSAAQILQYEVGHTRVSAGVLYQISILFKVDVGYFFKGYKEHKKKIKNKDSTLKKFQDLDQDKQEKLISLLELLN